MCASGPVGAQGPVPRGPFVATTPSGVLRVHTPDGRAHSGEPRGRPPVPAPPGVGRPGREDRARAAVTGSNPARSAFCRVNARARRAAARAAPGAPAGQSPYRLATPTRAPPLGWCARPRAPIGLGDGRSHAPSPAPRAPDKGRFARASRPAPSVAPVCPPKLH